MKYKLIASDLDGTLLNKQRSVSDKNISLIKGFIKSTNSQFCLVSGRPPYFIKDIADTINLGEKIRYLVGYNGAVVYDLIEDMPVFEEVFNSVYAFKIIEYFMQKDIKIVIFTEDKVYVNLDFEGVERYYGDKVVKLDTDNFNPGKHKIYKMSAFGFNPILPNELLDMANFSFYNEHNGLVDSEISPKNINKGGALNKICELMSITLHEVLAFGDAANDVEMLKIAGHSVAPANVEMSARIAADEIDIRTNDENFVGEYLNSLIANNQ
ncbi:HAD family phosphatase [Candidatus Saccharibacteria bacterium]|nr:HAD family phosphatase [Candidatus Saccharibacteria bacterium]